MLVEIVHETLVAPCFVAVTTAVPAKLPETLIFGVLSEVMLSVAEPPVSEVVSRSGVEGVATVVLLITNPVSVAALEVTLLKVCVAATEYVPLASVVNGQVPVVPVAVNEHTTAVPEDGVAVIPAEDGFLASGLSGEGRMAEPETIFNYIEDYFKSKQDPFFIGKQVIVTAGPTFESIDPVRFIGNHSSGKMGYEIVKQFLDKGAYVTLISGPTKLSLEHPNLNLIRITTAEELLTQVKEFWPKSDIGVFSAAVADYRPKEIASQKIKKNSFRRWLRSMVFWLVDLRVPRI